MTFPLSGVRVLDLTRLLPGGWCTLMLADLGADVIKIEDPDGGDYTRRSPPDIGGQSVMFEVLNRNKRSLILDLKAEGGQFALKRLVATADVLVESFRPGVMARLNSDYAALKPINPRLIYGALSGWGQAGPYAELSGHDLNYVAVAGVIGLMEIPLIPGGQMADIGGAYVALAGILAGLFQRERTGEGCLVDASLFEAVFPFMLHPWIEATLTGAAGGQGALTGGLACYSIYRARDGKPVALAALEPKFWGNFCTAIGRPDLVPDYLSAERQKYLKTELNEIFALKTAPEWDTLLHNADCCFSVVNPPQAAANDPQVQARKLVDRDEQGAPWMRSPLRLNVEEPAHTPAPSYGEHTRTVLSEAGFSDTEIDELFRSGAAKAG